MIGKSPADILKLGGGGPDTNSTDVGWWGEGGYLDIGSKALSSLGNMYLGYNTLKLGKQQLSDSRKQFGMNWGAQAQLANQERSDKLYVDYLNQGYNAQQAQALTNQTMATQAIPLTVEGAKQAYMSPSNVPAPQAYQAPAPSSTAMNYSAPNTGNTAPVAEKYKMNYIVG